MTDPVATCEKAGVTLPESKYIVRTFFSHNIQPCQNMVAAGNFTTNSEAITIIYFTLDLTGSPLAARLLVICCLPTKKKLMAEYIRLTAINKC